jgi:hypothetical protein
MTGQGPLRIVFFMLHAGFLRFYGSTVEELARRGHSVHLAFTQVEKNAGDRGLAERLAASSPLISFGDAPLRPRRDGWRPLAALVRSLVDLGRYVDPRYADAPALRARMARKFGDHVRTARAIDPLTRALTLRAIGFLATRSSARLSRAIVRSLGAVERAIPTCPAVDGYLRERSPDAVLVTPVIEFASTQVEYLKSARRAGIPAGVGVASWDNLTGKGLIRVVPDRVYVWNELQVREAVELHGVPRERVVATGAPKFDEWFERRPSLSREAFAAKVGLDPARPFVLYACSSYFIAPDEAAFVQRWLGELRARPEPGLREVGVLVRPHPQNAGQWHGVDLSRFGGAALWPREGAQPDAGEARADFFDSLAHGAAVVGINTSALIEAAIAGRSVLAPPAPEYAGTQQGTLHFRYLLYEQGGFVHLGKTMDEHFRQLAGVLERGDEDAERTRSFVASFVRPHGVDRPAAPILAGEIEALARSAAAPSRPPLGAYVLRVLLTPAALAAGLVGNAAGRLRRRPGPVPELA